MKKIDGLYGDPPDCTTVDPRVREFLIRLMLKDEDTGVRGMNA